MKVHHCCLCWKNVFDHHLKKSTVVPFGKNPSDAHDWLIKNKSPKRLKGICSRKNQQITTATPKTLLVANSYDHKRTGGIVLGGRKKFALKITFLSNTNGAM